MLRGGPDYIQPPYIGSGQYRRKKPAFKRVSEDLRTTENVIAYHLVPRARLELARLAARDFESRASTDSATGATQKTI